MWLDSRFDVFWWENFVHLSRNTGEITRWSSVSANVLTYLPTWNFLAQCGNLAIFLLLSFYVKSIFVSLKWILVLVNFAQCQSWNGLKFNILSLRNRENCIFSKFKDSESAIFRMLEALNIEFLSNQGGRKIVKFPHTVNQFYWSKKSSKSIFTCLLRRMLFKSFRPNAQNVDNFNSKLHLWEFV